MDRWTALAIAAGFLGFFGFMGISAYSDGQVKIAQAQAQAKCNPK